MRTGRSASARSCRRCNSPGWTIGINLRIDQRWAVDEEALRRAALELVELAPDVMLATGAGIRNTR